MDITNESLKSMKAKQLRRLIREAIEEVLSEETFAGKNAIADLESDAGYAALSTDAKANAKKELQKGGSVTLEGDLSEAKTYRLADPNFDTSTFADKRIRGIAVSTMLDWIKNNPGVSAKRFKEEFGFPKEQAANAFLNAFHQSGILTKLSSGGEEINVRQPAAPGEEEESEEVVTGPESFLIGRGDPLAGMFDNTPNADGSEDFNDEEEPTVGDIEPGEPATTGGMSDEDYEAFMSYDTLRNRLAATKSDLNKLRRRKGSVAGDISDKPSNEEQNLRNLKKSLEDRINALVAKSTYLQKKVEKETGKAYEPIEVEPEEEDTIDEAYNAEYEKRKLQFYAGIIK
jgi:hypothetical protein